jgi:hypothetical protein
MKQTTSGLAALAYDAIVGPERGRAAKAKQPELRLTTEGRQPDAR